MARTAVVLLLVVAIAYVSAYPQQPQETCGPNEVFTSCGSPCEQKCGQDHPPVCTLRCMIGCQCKEGYVRNNENKCVLTRDC